MTQERRQQDSNPMISSSAQPSVAQELAPLFSDIATIIQQSRQQVQRVVNSAMVHCYWHIGRLIVEYEQQVHARAAYGKCQLEALSDGNSAKPSRHLVAGDGILLSKRLFPEIE